MGMSFGQNKGPSWIGRPFGNKVVVLLSHVRVRSIIDDGELNCRVRNGIGCTLSSMNTKTNLYVILIDRGLGRGKFLKNKPLGLLVLVS